MAEGGQTDLPEPDSSTGHNEHHSSVMEKSSQDVSSSILVSNIGVPATKDLLINFFESRDQNLAIKDIEIHDGGHDKALVIFETPVDVAHIQQICMENPLQGKTLHAEVFQQKTVQVLPCLCTEAVFFGVAVSNDHLINLLECELKGCEVKDVLCGTKKNTAKVVFESPVDFHNLKQSCDGKVVEGQELKVQPADERGAVLVLNPNPGTKDNSFDFYFRNKRRSDGGNVLSSIRDKENKYLIVYFETKEVAKRVVGKDHNLEDIKLDIKLFDPDIDDPLDLCGGQGDVSSTSHSQSAPLSSASIPGGAASHIPPGHPVAENAKSGGPDNTEDSDLTEGLENMTLQERKKEMQKKPERVRRNVEDLHEVYIMILDAFSEHIEREFHVTLTTDKRLVMIEGEEKEVKIVEKLLSTLLERQKSSRYLKEVADQFTGWEEVFTDIEKKIASGDNFYLVLCEHSVDANELCIGLLSSDDENDLLSFDDFLRMHVNKSKVPVKSKAARDFLSTTAWDEFVETQLEENCGRNIEVLHEKVNDQIILLGSAEHLNEAAQFVEKFLEDTTDQKTINLTQKEKDFLKAYCSSDLESLQFGTGLENAHIEIIGNVCEIKGCTAGVLKATKRLKDIIRKLCYKRAIFTHPNLTSFVKAKKGIWDDLVKQVSTENRCIIDSLPDSRLKETDSDGEEWGQWSTTVIHSFSLSAQVKLHVTEGDAEDLKVDAAVVCYNGHRAPSSDTQQRPPNTQMCGQGTGARPKDSANTRQEHQSSVQTEGAQSRNHGNNTCRGERPASNQPRGIHMTSSGALPCKVLIHVDLSCYLAEETSATFENALYALMKDILQECEHQHFASLAFPTFGVDISARNKPEPIDVATRGIALTCCDLLAPERQQYHRKSERRETSCVQEVFLCSRRSACLHGLTFALEDWHGPSLVSLSPKQHTFQYLSCYAQDNELAAGQMNAISVSKGDISRAKADVLIVPLDIDIDLDLSKSKVTRSLLSGGKAVQYTAQHGTGIWVQKIEDRNEDLADEHVVDGSAGYLQAKEIFYVYIPPWGPGVQKLLTERVQKCLQKATEKRFKTVAMTALGVGKLGYPPEFAARTSMAAVADFWEQEKTTLENVNFVVFPADWTTYNAFSTEQNEWQKHRAFAADGNQLPPLRYPHHPSSTFYPPPYPSTYADVTSGNPRRGGRGNGSERGRHSFWPPPPEAGPYGHSTELKYPNQYSGKFVASFRIGQIKLLIRKSNILFEKCDAVVNSINDEFDFNRGGVARAFKKHCGDQLLSICNEKGKKKKMKKKGLVVTEAAGLPHCKTILHLDLDLYLKNPKDTIKECFYHLRDKKVKSVAFPALATGEANYHSPEELARYMVEALKEIKKPKQLEDVRIVLLGRKHFDRLVTKVTALLPHPNKPSAKSKGQKEKHYAAAATTEAQTPPSLPPQPLSPPSPPPQLWESVCLKGYSADLSNDNTVSLFFLSDSEENQQAAINGIAEGIVNILGPVPDEPPRRADRRGHKKDHDGGRRAWYDLRRFLPN